MTDYGRAQTEALLRSTYGEPVEEPGKVKDFAFGVVDLPDAVIAQVDVRGLLIPRPGQFRGILMQSDLRGGLQNEDFIAYASIGIVSEGANGARIVSDEGAGNEAVVPVARDYWVGWRPARGWTVRGGRMNLPFGIRSDQHILYTRAITRTTTNADQQLGVSGAYETKKSRGEVMAVFGNLQVGPDAFRERGYSGYATYVPANSVELGVSSLVLGSQLDIATLEPTTRQAHGVFTRISPVEKLALLGEGNVLLTSAGLEGARDNDTGFVLDAHLDWEAVRGLHFKAGGEYCDTAFADAGSASRGWGAIQWFFAPHINLRIDGMYGPLQCVADAESRPMILGQLHAFL
ncbi:MAG: hypothetical protein AAF602_18005 [Myxococcota bacterium]